MKKACRKKSSGESESGNKRRLTSRDEDGNRWKGKISASARSGESGTETTHCQSTTYSISRLHDFARLNRSIGERIASNFVWTKERTGNSDSSVGQGQESQRLRKIIGCREERLGVLAQRSLDYEEEKEDDESLGLASTARRLIWE